MYKRQVYGLVQSQFPASGQGEPGEVAAGLAVQLHVRTQGRLFAGPGGSQREGCLLYTSHQHQRYFRGIAEQRAQSFGAKGRQKGIGKLKKAVFDSALYG